MKKILQVTLMMMLLTVSAVGQAATKQNVLTLKESITDNDIVFPYSFMTDTHAMMNNWYLQNYAVLDKDVDKRSPGVVTEEEYIRRLKAIPTTVELPYNQVVRAHIDRYVKSRALVEQMLGMSLYYMPIFEEALEREGLPLELKYIPIIESAMNPEATSPVGAAGLWQFMPATGKSLGLEVNTLVDERRDPYLSSDRAAKFFKQLYEVYGDWSLCIAAYNCGPGNVNKAIVRSGNDNADFWTIYNYLPKETRGYVPAFIAATYIMNYYKQHNISPAKARKPLITDTITVNHRVHFNQIASVLNIPIDELRVLNPQYRRDIIPGDLHPYRLILPSQQIYSYIMAEDRITRYQQEQYGRRGRVEPGTGDYEITEDDIFPEATIGDSQPTTELVASSATTHASTAASATIPPRPGSTGGGSSAASTGFHKVQRGETLETIAENYGMSADDLMALNGLTSSQVRANQILKVEKHGTGGGGANATGRHSGDMAMSSSRSSNNYGSTSRTQPASSTAAVPERRQQPAQSTTTRQTVPERPAQSHSQAATTQQPVPASTHSQASQSSRHTAQAAQPAQTTSRRGRHHQQQAATTQTTKKNKRNNKQNTAPKTTNVTVKSGDNLETIARKNGTTVDQLKKDNNLKGDVIRPGQNLKVNKSGGNKKNSGSTGTSKRKRRR